MKLTIESTEITTIIDGVPVRLWEGVTESGIPCKAFVHRVVVHNDEDQAEFARELELQHPPGRYIPLSMIL